MDTSDFKVDEQKILNGVRYEELPETSIAVARTFERQFFQKNDYSSSTCEAICDWNTGSKFINPRRSYLTFKVKLDAGNATFGHGSACNLIRRVVITTRSGTELSRTEEYNVLMAKLLRYESSRAYIQQFGEILGLSDEMENISKNSTQLDTTEQTFVVPLPMLSPFFQGDGKSLIPPQAAAGLRIQLTFDTDARSLISEGAPKYEICDISIVANASQMVDSWEKKINEESARDGLTYTYPEWHTTQSTLPASQSRINIEVRKAVARALLAFTVTQTESSGYDKDNMKSDSYTATSVEYRLGSLYPTQQPIKTSKEAYFIAQSMWDANLLDCKRTNSVSFSQFENGTPVVPNYVAEAGEIDAVPPTVTDVVITQATGGVSDGDAITAVSLERSDISINGVLSISGMPTNNSKSLAVDITLPPVGGARQNYLFMKHMRMVKFFLDNSVVAE